MSSRSRFYRNNIHILSIRLVIILWHCGSNSIIYISCFILALKHKSTLNLKQQCGPVGSCIVRVVDNSRGSWWIWLLNFIISEVYKPPLFKFSRKQSTDLPSKQLMSIMKKCWWLANHLFSDCGTEGMNHHMANVICS